MVAVVLHGPPWFFLLDAVLGFVGMAGAILIVALSAKALKLTKDRKFIYFTIAFALIGFIAGFGFIAIANHKGDHARTAADYRRLAPGSQP